MTRVQIPAYTDRWMMGDRTGEIIKTVTIISRAFMPPQEYELVDVKLDRSGKTVRVILADCEVL